MFGVYTPNGTLWGHYGSAGEASRMALALGEGARVVSDRGAYVVRDGALRLMTSRCVSCRAGWRPMPDDYVAGWMADAYGGCLN